MKYFEKIKFFKNSMKEFKKEVKIKDSFIEDMDYFRGYVTFKEHNLVIIDKEKILTKTEILDFAIEFCNNKNFSVENYAQTKKILITESTTNETPNFSCSKNSNNRPPNVEKCTKTFAWRTISFRIYPQSV